MVQCIKRFEIVSQKYLTVACVSVCAQKRELPSHHNVVLAHVCVGANEREHSETRAGRLIIFT